MEKICTWNHIKWFYSQRVLPIRILEPLCGGAAAVMAAAASQEAERGSRAITVDEPVLGEPLPGGHSSSLRPTIFIQRDNLLLS